MAYAVASGNWNVGATWNTGVPPTAAEIAQIPLGITVTLPAATTCFARSLEVQSGGGLTYAASSCELRLGDDTAGIGNSIVNISSGATITLTGNGVTRLFSTSATQQTVTTNGKSLGQFIIDGTGGNYLLNGDLTTTSTWSMIATSGSATFDTGGYAMTINSLTLTGGGTKTLALGSSIVTVTSGNTPVTVTAVNLTVTFTSGAAEIRVQQAVNAMSWGSQTWPHVKNHGTPGAAWLSGALTCEQFTYVGGASQLWGPTFTGNLTVTGLLTIAGADAINRVFVQSNTDGTARTITAGSTALTNVDWQDITAAGAAAWDCSGTPSSDRGGNSGITFPSDCTYTRGATPGSWSNAGSWAITSGSRGFTTPPLAQDTVLVPAGAGNITSTDVFVLGGDLDFSGYTGTLTITSSSSPYKAFGSVKWSSGMTTNNPNTFYFEMRGRGSHTVDMNGLAFWPRATSNMRVDWYGFGGTYTVLTDIVLSCTAAGYPTFNHYEGTLDAAGRTVTSGTFGSTGNIARSITLGEAIATATGGTTVWTSSGSNLTQSVGKLTIAAASASTRSVANSGYIGEIDHTAAGTNGPVQLATYAGFTRKITVRGGNTVLVSTAIQPVIDELNIVSASSGSRVEFKSSTGGTKANVQFSGPPQNLDFVNFTDIESILPEKVGIGGGSSQSNCTNILSGTIDTSKPYVKAFSQQSLGATVVLARPFDAGSIAVYALSGATAIGDPSGWTQVKDSPLAIKARSWWKKADGGETSIATPSSGLLYHGVWELGNVGNAPTFQAADKYTATVTAQDAGDGGPTADVDDLALDWYGASGSMGAHVSITGPMTFLKTITALGSTTSGRAAAGRITSAGAVASTLTWTTSRNMVSQRILVRYGNVAAPSGDQGLMMSGPVWF